MRKPINREALVVVTFSVMQLVMGLVGTRLLTQFAPPDALGAYYLYMNLALWLTLPTASSYLYIWKNWTIARATGTASGFAQSIRRGLELQAALCVAICFGIRSLHIVNWSWGVLGALALASIAQAVSQALDQIQTLERRRVLAGLLGLFATPLRYLVLALCMRLVTNRSGPALLWIQALYGIAVAVVSTRWFLSALRSNYRSAGTVTPTTSGATLRDFVRFSLPLLVTAMATQAAASAERWGLALRGDPGMTALFVQAVATSTAAVNATTLPITNYFAPLISQAAAQAHEDALDGARPQIRAYLLVSGLALAVTAIAVAFLSAPLTALFFGPKYQRIAILLPWVIVGQTFYGLAQAVSIVPVTANSTVGVAGSLVASRTLYVVVLMALPCLGACDLWFSKCFALANVIYFVGICWAAGRALTSRKRRVAQESVSI